MAQNTHTRSITMGDGNAHCGNVIGSHNTTIYNANDDAEIMRWLSPLELKDRHQGVCNDRLDSVGSWLWETREWRGWRGGSGGADRAVLFCSGSPGVGKTYLSSIVIDNLHDHAETEGIDVAGLYYDFSSQQEQTVTNVLGAILKQLVSRGGIPEDIRKAFQRGGGEFGSGLRPADLVGMLKIATAPPRRVFICVDALDECLPKYLPKILESLRDIVQESPTTRIFLTGRPHVREDIKKYFTKVVEIPISPNTNDIRSYLEMRLNEDADPEAMNDDLRGDIVEAILENISDIFLLVSLNIGAILGEVTIRQRRKKLEEMKRGGGLSDAYTATLTRLKAQQGDKSILGLKVLMWVLYSERPLRAEELCHALGVEMGSADLDLENVPALRTLLASCLGLVRIEASSSTVRLVHFTLQEYLSSNPMIFHSPHPTIAEVCLAYLNFRCVRDLSPTVYPPPSTMPLLEYASRYWGKHARRGMTENAKLLALMLLDRFDEHISAQLLLLHYNQTRGSDHYFDRAGGPIGFTGLHGVAFLGIAEIFGAVLGMKEWDVNATDCMGSTVLIWAIEREQEEIVQVLLEREDINPNKADTKYRRTPLVRAVGSEYEGLKIPLLERRDINPNMVDTEYGRTPLIRAVESGHEGLVKMLLERQDTNPNMADTKYGQTPLIRAVESGHEGLVKILLEREDTNPNAAGISDGWTPLTLAAGNGLEKVVKILLGREDVNADQACAQCGRTPLSLAAECGNEGVVKMFLGRVDVNPNTADTRYGRTPLSWAAEDGHAVVVKMLLEDEGINTNTADTESGRTPLSWAAENGHTEVVKVLLEREDVNPNTASTQDGRTPLSCPAWHGYKGVVKMLLERKDVHTATPDIKNQTSLSLALSKGNDEIVRIPVERDNVDPGTGDHSGQAFFPPSAGFGNECVMEMRLRYDSPNTEVANHDSQSAVKKPAAEKQMLEKSAVKEPGGNFIPSSEEIGERLKDLIMRYRKSLRKMYGETEAELNKSLKIPIERGEAMARKLVTEMGCGREVAKDLTVLTLYDVAILIDDSGSGIYEEQGARKKVLAQFIDHIMEIYLMANEAGIVAMRFMNGCRGKNNWIGKPKDYLDHLCYGGPSRIGTALKARVLDRFATGNPNQSKPLLVLIVTNSAVKGERKGYLKKVIQDCVSEREGAGFGRDAVIFQFSRIGNDPGAAQLLIDLDEDPDLRGFVDALPVEFDLERQPKDKWFVLPKVLLGAILPDWDRQDDRERGEEQDHIGDRMKEKGFGNAGSVDDWQSDENEEDGGDDEDSDGWD